MTTAQCRVLVDRTKKAKKDYEIWRSVNNNADPLGLDDDEDPTPPPATTPDQPFAASDELDTLPQDEGPDADPSSLFPPYDETVAPTTAYGSTSSDPPADDDLEVPLRPEASSTVRSDQSATTHSFDTSSDVSRITNRSASPRTTAASGDSWNLTLKLEASSDFLVKQSADVQASSSTFATIDSVATSSPMPSISNSKQQTDDDDDKESIISLGDEVSHSPPVMRAPSPPAVQVSNTQHASCDLSKSQSTSLLPAIPASSLHRLSMQELHDAYDDPVDYASDDSSDSDGRSRKKKRRVGKARAPQQVTPLMAEPSSSTLQGILAQKLDFTALVREIHTFKSKVGPSPDRKRARNAIAEPYIAFIKSYFPTAEVVLRGSTWKELYTDQSDLDFYIRFSSDAKQPTNVEESRLALEELLQNHVKRRFRGYKWIVQWSTGPLQSKNVPVLQFTLQDNGRRYKADLCVQLPRQKVDEDRLWEAEKAAIEKAGKDECLYIIPLLKTFLQYHNLASGALGGVSGTCQLALVTHRLNMLGDLFRTKARKSLGFEKWVVILLLDILHYYATSFDNRAAIVLGDATQRPSMASKGWSNSLGIVDPRDPKINLARSVTQWSAVRSAFAALSHSIRNHLQDGTSRFCPDVMWNRYLSASLTSEEYATISPDLSKQEVDQAATAMRARLRKA